MRVIWRKTRAIWGTPQIYFAGRRYFGNLATAGKIANDGPSGGPPVAAHCWRLSLFGEFSDWRENRL
jgi:hypothetical protein